MASSSEGFASVLGVPTQHPTVPEADVEQAGRVLVHAVATFAVLHR